MPSSRIASILHAMEAARASDLLLSPDRPPAIRVDGHLRSIDQPPVSEAEIREALEAVLPVEALARFDTSGSLEVGFSLGRLRFRASLARARGALAVVVRALPSGALTFEELGLPPALATFLEPPRGLLLVTGATGSGKSTTLAAIVHHLNRTRPVHVVTVEDPIEFVHADLQGRVTQREVGTDTPSFHAALRDVVRQSPDVVMVGEIRDRPTVEVVLSAALAGHLVLASLHTVDASQTLQRLLGWFPEDTRGQVALDLSLALRGILSQRLLPRADGKGRVVAVELLTNSPAAATCIRDQRVGEILDLVRADPGPGMCSFNESLLGLLKDGRITEAAGLAHASNPDEFALWARGMTTGVDGFRGQDFRRLAAGFDMKGLLGVALEQKASDLHLAAGRPPMLRLGGGLVPLGSRMLSDADVRMLLFSILSARQREQYELEREVDFALALEGGRRFRVNAYFQRGRMAAALRTIPSQVPSAQELRIPEFLLDLGDRPQGLILVVGPTGSGKSTTLACLVDRINRTRACRILTVEDPIEYVHEGVLATVDQREVHADTRSFAAALKYILRQDPDVILVGEMRDVETISAAITAAETGHLVLSTLHTNDAVQTVDRIVDVFPSHQQPQVRTQLAACLLGVASQRLLKAREGNRRVAVFEILAANAAIRNLIRENKMHQAYGIMEASRRDGSVTMDAALQDLVNEGLITMEEGQRHMRNARTLREAEAAAPIPPPPPRGSYPRRPPGKPPEPR
ncbi:MAG: PilT/PilU family type 4a pilus ATPase [Deltaproteobacteria bacterium]|nr:PilT/PilU family type 4a pilus ATPase [Deltaproteobacteria bacterium]